MSVSMERFTSIIIAKPFIKHVKYTVRHWEGVLHIFLIGSSQQPCYIDVFYPHLIVLDSEARHIN